MSIGQVATAQVSVPRTSRARTRPPVPAPRWLVYAVEVAATERLGPSLVRLTFTAEALHGFGAGGHDQRVKLFLPRPGRTMADLPEGDSWWDLWRAMPHDTRPTLRTYTVRAFRPERGELDIDFVLHGVGDDEGHGDGTAGPAATWAAGAKPGDQAGLVGPDRPGTGQMWGCEWSPPASTKRLLLAGDETAVPAMGSIVESLPPDARGVVCVEVPYAGDRQSWRTPDGVDVRWLVRADGGGAGGPAEHGVLLESAVAEAMDALRGGRGDDPRSGVPGAVDVGTSPNADITADINAETDVDTAEVFWDVPGDAAECETPLRFDVEQGALYGWLAGEAGMIKRLRRLLVNQYQVPRTSVAFMGYWRRGRTETD